MTDPNALSHDVAVEAPAADAGPLNSPLRQLSRAGLDRMRIELEGIGPADWPGFSEELLFDDKLAPVLDEAVIVRPRRFGTRAELAEAVAKIVEQAGLKPSTATRMPGLWSWLAAFWCDAFRRENDTIGLRADQYWFTQTRGRGTHVTLAPYEAWLATEGVSEQGRQVLLHSHPSVLPKISSDLAANRRLQRNPTVLDVAAALYLKPRGQGRIATKPKAATIDQPGGFSRMIRLLDQLDRTYDLHDLTPQALWDLLPAEFEPYKDGPLVPTPGPVATSR